MYQLWFTDETVTPDLEAFQYALLTSLKKDIEKPLHLMLVNLLIRSSMSAEHSDIDATHVIVSGQHIVPSPQHVSPHCFSIGH